MYYQCQLCNRSYKDKKALQRHLKTHVNWSDKQFICKLCSKGFSERTAFKDHLSSKGHIQNQSEAGEVEIVVPSAPQAQFLVLDSIKDKETGSLMDETVSAVAALLDSEYHPVLGNLSPSALSQSSVPVIQEQSVIMASDTSVPAISTAADIVVPTGNQLLESTATTSVSNPGVPVYAPTLSPPRTMQELSATVQSADGSATPTRDEPLQLQRPPLISTPVKRLKLEPKVSKGKSSVTLASLDSKLDVVLRDGISKEGVKLVVNKALEEVSCEISDLSKRLTSVKDSANEANNANFNNMAALSNSIGQVNANTAELSKKVDTLTSHVRGLIDEVVNLHGKLDQVVANQSPGILDPCVVIAQQALLYARMKTPHSHREGEDATDCAICQQIKMICDSLPKL